MSDETTTIPPIHSDEDYLQFIGPNGFKYLAKFKNYSATPLNFHASWNWSACFATFWWYLYRKMYLWALLVFISACIPYFNILTWIGWSVAANHLYFKHTNAKISELQSFQKDGYQSQLPFVGGVNKWVIWVAILVSLFFFIVIFAMLGMAAFLLSS